MLAEVGRWVNEAVSCFQIEALIFINEYASVCYRDTAVVTFTALVPVQRDPLKPDCHRTSICVCNDLIMHNKNLNFRVCRSIWFPCY